MTTLARSTTEHPPAAAPRSARVAPPTRTLRVPALDIVRGVAIIAVVLYHLQWDLYAVGLRDVNWCTTPVGHVVGRCIAGTFLLLVGVSMAFAHRATWRSGAFWRREGKLMAAGAVVTAASLMTEPQAFVSFGILQDIAVTSLLLVPFLHASRLAALGAALAAYALPHLVTVESSSRWVTWTGLSSHVLPTVDYQPLLPMLGLSLVGLVLGRTVVPALDSAIMLTRPVRSALPRTLGALGRRTLVIYLLHQPVLLGTLWLVTR